MVRLYLNKIFGDEWGLTLVESLVTVAIISIALTAFAVALSTGSLAVGESDEEVTAQGLARTQMEYTKGYPYKIGATTYPTVNATKGYSIAVSVTSVPGGNANIQKVTTNISRGGQVLLTIADYKVNR